MLFNPCTQDEQGGIQLKVKNIYFELFDKYFDSFAVNFACNFTYTFGSVVQKLISLTSGLPVYKSEHFPNLNTTQGLCLGLDMSRI